MTVPTLARYGSVPWFRDPSLTVAGGEIVHRFADGFIPAEHVRLLIWTVETSSRPFRCFDREVGAEVLVDGLGITLAVSYDTEYGDARLIQLHAAHHLAFDDAAGSWLVVESHDGHGEIFHEIPVHLIRTLTLSVAGAPEPDWS